MKILELFSGTECISNTFRSRGHEAFSVDWDSKLSATLHCDIEHLTPKVIENAFGVPDIIWAAPDCTTYSLAAISHHRKKNKDTGNLDPISDYATKCDKVNLNVIEIIKYFKQRNPKLIFFIENPRACLQKMNFMKPLEKFKHVITYCKYMTNVPVTSRRMKPTNIWTNHPSPKFKEPCSYGDNCHQSAPRGSKLGTQGLKTKAEKSSYPRLLCEHIADICEEYINKMFNN